MYSFFLFSLLVFCFSLKKRDKGFLDGSSRYLKMHEMRWWVQVLLKKKKSPFIFDVTLRDV